MSCRWIMAMTGMPLLLNAIEQVGAREGDA
jgi:hypothetical protein